MFRLWKFRVVAILAVFLSACNFVTQTEVPTPEPTPTPGNMYDPQGAPVQEWMSIPIMPQATDGQEFIEADTYSFKAQVTPKEIQDFYEANLTTLGWYQPFGMPVEEDGGIMIFQNENSILTITILPSEGSTLVTLGLGYQ